MTELRHFLDLSDAGGDAIAAMIGDALDRKVRAFDPWPIAEGDIAGDVVRIHRAIAIDSTANAAPGTVLDATRDGIDIACGRGALRVRVLQRAGGKAITAADYLNARRDLAP